MKPLILSSTRQGGAALIVGLIIIFALSIMGISNMRGAVLESRMTTNAVHASTTFQAAESATDIVLNDKSNLSTVWAAQGDTVKYTPDTQGPDALSVNVDIGYVGDGVATGFSLGQTGNGFMSLRYEVLGTAGLGSGSTESNIRQGAYRVVPAN